MAVNRDNPITFLPSQDFPDDLDPARTLDYLDERLRDPGAQPPDLVVSDEPPPPPGRSWSFDFPRKRFVTRRGGGVAKIRGLETLRQWCEKALRTDRGAHPIHSDDYGMVRPFDMIGARIGSGGKDQLRQRVEQCVTFHPRIVGIQDFEVTYDPNDSILSVSFSVVLVDDEELLITDLRVA